MAKRILLLINSVTPALLSALTLFSLSGVGFAQETSSQRLGKALSLVGAEREKALIEGAKKEGELNLYFVLGVSEGQPFASVFQKQYPFLKVNYIRAGRGAIMTKILTEVRVGAFRGDLIQISPDEAYHLIKGGITDRYLSPYAKDVKKGYYDPNGNWTALYYSTMVLAYNNTRVAPGDVPKRYEDVLNPKWKGKLILDVAATDWFGMLVESWGEKKAVDFGRQLVKQEIQFRRGHRLQLLLLSAGEVDIAPKVYGETGYIMKSAGAPIDFALLKPHIIKPYPMLLVKKASHPFAAALFYDWSLSEKGQAALQQFARVSVLERVKPRYPALMVENPLVITPEGFGPNYERYINLFKDTFGIKTAE
ncbi:MAG: extracellular solute-binding protein [Deltaproteobacteria bacterium]|nr:extracellular solute-binding protein [Deltaproteobacteria bacterium]